MRANSVQLEARCPQVAAQQSTTRSVGLVLLVVAVLLMAVPVGPILGEGPGGPSWV